MKSCKDVKIIPNELEKIITEYHIGQLSIIQKSDEVITLKLKDHSSVRDLMGKGIKSDGNFCSFEAGLLAGIVERMSNYHCFAQEINCSMQSGADHCEFMIVFQKD